MVPDIRSVNERREEMLREVRANRLAKALGRKKGRRGAGRRDVS